MQKKRPKITDVARLAGVSPTTVSFVLNGKGRIAGATRKRVEEAMRKAGFIRDQSAASLRSGESKLVGIVTTDVSNPYFAEMTSGVDSVLSARGYLTIVCNTSDDPQRQSQLMRTILGHGVAGIIIVPAAGTLDSDLAIGAVHDVPVITCVRRVDGAQLDFVGAGDYEGAFLAVSHFLDQGHKAIGMVGGVPETTTWQNRHGGYLKALQSRGIRVRDDWTVTGIVTRDFCIRATQKLLAARPKITAVFAYNDYAAMWIYAGLRQAGREVGKDVAVAGFDNLAESEACLPALTTVESYPRTLGAAAGEMLLRRLAKPNGPLERLELTPRLIVRASSPPRR